jgi:2-oxoisovalerate dehydrogenase E2 component (dihydrolipoyl transacylase)
MALREFKLPDPGEGLTEAELVTWHVAVGDTVKVNDIVVEVETAKSLVELPVPFAGTVTSLHAAEGDTFEVGTTIITVDDGVGGSPDAVAPAPAAAAAPAPATPEAPEAEIGEGLIGGTTSTGRTAVLVGYGVKQTEAKRRPRKGAEAAATSIAAPSVRQPEAHHEPAAGAPSTTGSILSQAEPVSPERSRALAKPPVRKLAKDLGVDLASLTPGGPGGVVTRADVEAAASGSTDAATAAGRHAASADRDEWREPIKGVRKMMAQAMVQSAFTAPHVTEWITVDVSRTSEFVQRLKARREFAEVRVSPLLVLAWACIRAIRRTPVINSRWDEQAQEIVFKRAVNLGIAAATPRGLVVPNVKDADTMSLLELAGALGDLTTVAREGRTQPADMSGGTFTITNVGVFGVDAGTPIINPGESAILAFGATTRRPWVVTDKDGRESLEIRDVCTLALSFDHRHVDGESGSRFLADVAAIMEDPVTALLF